MALQLVRQDALIFGGLEGEHRNPEHVSQWLGHASPVVTMTVYAHVLPGSQREAADLFARLVREAQ